MSSENSHLYVVILAGGSGERFWPASRSKRPKQLLTIAPGSDLSLIGQTVRRLESLVPSERIFIATNARLVDATRESVPWLPTNNFFAEPFARNTGPCIGWVTDLIHRRDPRAVVCILPSDHHIRDEAGFLSAVRLAVSSAEQGVITTIGVRASRPETGYGYIEAGVPLGDGILSAVRFVEKPDSATAQRYVSSGLYYWNAGMFFFMAGAMLTAISQHMPELWAGLQQIRAQAARGPEFENAETTRVFESIAPVSIDHGVMEKISPLAVVPAEFGWSDLGSWQTLWELKTRDAQSNAAPEHVIFQQASGNLVEDLRSDKSQKRIYALLGVQDLCVVDTDDALLILPRERCQDVREIVRELRRRGELI